MGTIEETFYYNSSYDLIILMVLMLMNTFFEKIKYRKWAAMEIQEMNRLYYYR